MIRHWMLRATLFLLALLGSLSAWQWFGSEKGVISSKALGTEMPYRTFNSGSAGPIIYALDGQQLRNSLAPAIIFSTLATLKGQPLPRIVAVESDKSRDENFRPTEGTPKDWRPVIRGRSDKFDQFLTEELIPLVERSFEKAGKRYLMGHSLAGLYALDFAARDSNLFIGILAFAPTFSHDTSIADRLSRLCSPNTIIYINWGLESARDTEVFDSITGRWKTALECQINPPHIARHYGAIHQVVMLTGQVDSAWRFLN